MARSKTYGKEKYQEKILFELNENLRRLSDPRLSQVSITKVELLEDYSQAKVYWDSFKLLTFEEGVQKLDEELLAEIQDAFKKASGKLRANLAQFLKVRHVPEIQFEFDSQLYDMGRIEELLRS